MTIRIGDYRRNSIVRSKRHPLSVLLGIKFECAILMMSRMKVATGQERAHFQFDCSVIRSLNDMPGDEYFGLPFRDEQFLLYNDVLVDFVAPTRPWLVFKGRDSRSAVRVNHIRAIALR